MAWQARSFTQIWMLDTPMISAAGPCLPHHPARRVGPQTPRRRTLSPTTQWPWARVARAFAAIADRADITAALSAHQIELLISAPGQVQALVEQEFAALRAVVVEEEPDVHPFMDAGVHLLRRHPSLLV